MASLGPNIFFHSSSILGFSITNESLLNLIETLSTNDAFLQYVGAKKNGTFKNGPLVCYSDFITHQYLKFNHQYNRYSPFFEILISSASSRKKDYKLEELIFVVGFKTPQNPSEIPIVSSRFPDVRILEEFFLDFLDVEIEFENETPNIFYGMITNATICDSEQIYELDD